jgi:hypothetical protein
MATICSTVAPGRPVASVGVVWRIEGNRTYGTAYAMTGRGGTGGANAGNAGHVVLSDASI